MKLLVVGTVAFDTIHTPFDKAEKIVGGAATYIGWAASHFVNNICLVSVVGDDFPANELADMRANGMNTEGIQIKEGRKSFFWEGKYSMDMNHRDTLVTDLNVLADFDPVIPKSYQDCDFLMLGNLSPQVQMRVIEQVPNKPKFVALDTMNFWMDNALEDLKAVIKKVDLITINDEEARQLSGEYSLRKAAKVIQAMGPEYLVIKKGEHGALLFHGEDMFFAPALPLEEVFDPTGAGDSFAGGFIGYLVKTNDLSFDNMKRALVYGSAVASYCVEQFGINNVKSLTPRMIHDRISDFVELMTFSAQASHLE